MKEIIIKILLSMCNYTDNIVQQIEKKCGFMRNQYQYVSDLNRDISGKQKRVLIAYLDYLYVEKELAGGVRHPNCNEFCQIIRYFLKNNYILDICACNDTNIVEYAKKQQYDVIFGLGYVFREVATNSKAFKILYMTENPYDVSYAKELERIEYFYERRNIKTKFVRTGMYYHKDDEKLADAIICMGDERYFRNLNVDVNRIWPTALVNAHKISFEKRDIRNFIVLGTDGFIHKGIDLLVEVFSLHKDWHLYLCGRDIHKILNKLKYLPVADNIHDCGYIDVQSEHFLKLAEMCTYILLPSCSEAPSTAIITGMCHGLLPIVMKGNGMDALGEYCLYFDGFLLEKIEEAICRAILLDEAECVRKAESVMKFAKEKFTIGNFTADLEQIFDTLLNHG